MKIVRFEMDGEIFYGAVKENSINVINGDIFEDYTITYKMVSPDEVKILPPCVPGKIICIGLNYIDHAKEVGIAIPKTPVVFMKPSTAVIGNMDYIEIPEMSKHIDYECELAVIIKKEVKNISEEDAKDAILGYTCGNDVTARDLQKPDGQWILCKGFDTFLPLGPCIETELDPMNLDIKTYLNGELKQSSNTKNLIFDVYTLISYLSKIMTLKPGDVIMTGTPSGISAMKAGDEVIVEIEKIGRLVNTVK